MSLLTIEFPCASLKLIPECCQLLLSPEFSSSWLTSDESIAVFTGTTVLMMLFSTIVIFYNTVIGEAIKGNRIAVMSCSENIIIQDLDIFRSNYPNCRYVWKVWFNLQVWNDCIICKILIWYVIVVINFLLEKLPDKLIVSLAFTNELIKLPSESK